MKKIIKGSWRTSTAGWAAVGTAIANAARLLMDKDTATNPDWWALISLVLVGFGLISARDNNVSSENVGIK